jgi:hypothetical protein
MTTHSDRRSKPTSRQRPQLQQQQLLLLRIKQHARGYIGLSKRRYKRTALVGEVTSREETVQLLLMSSN